jgi:hypothetical protein
MIGRLFDIYEITIDNTKVDNVSEMPDFSPDFSKKLFDKIISKNIFDFIIVHKSNMFKTKYYFNIWFFDDAIQKPFDVFRKSALKGYLAIGLRSNWIDVLEMFRRTSWQITPNAISQGTEYLNFIPEKQKLITLLVRLCMDSFLIFNHDADPIYMFVKKII